MRLSALVKSLIVLICHFETLTGFILYDNIPEDWLEIQKTPIQIETQIINNFPYCRANGVFNFPSKQIITLLDNQIEYPNVFERIKITRMLSDTTVYVRLDLPFPFNDRDYIVNYYYEKNDNIEYFYYNATNNHDISLVDKCVRLTNTSGIWMIESINENQTKLTYIWQGELMGDFPEWALETAWIEQANEVFTSINSFLSNK